MAGLKGKRMMKQVRQEQKSESRQIFLSFTNRNVSSVKKTNRLDPLTLEKNW